GSDEGATGGRFLSLTSPAGLQSLEFAVPIDEPGRYVVWGRVLTGTRAAALLAVSVDGAPESIWRVPRPRAREAQGEWRWVNLRAQSDQGRPEPLLLDLGAGRHRVRLRSLGDPIQVDGLLVSSDLDYRPRGVWPLSFETQPVHVWLEAEAPATPVV